MYKKFLIIIVVLVCLIESMQFNRIHVSRSIFDILSPNCVTSSNSEYPSFQQLIDEAEEKGVFDEIFGQEKGTLEVFKIEETEGDLHFYIIVHEIRRDKKGIKAEISYLLKNEDGSAREQRDSINIPCKSTVFWRQLKALDEEIELKMKKLLRDDKLFIQQTRLIRLRSKNAAEEKKIYTLGCKFAKEPSIEYWGVPLVRSLGLTTREKYSTGKNYVFVEEVVGEDFTSFHKNNSIEDADTGKIAAADMILGADDWHNSNIFATEDGLVITDLESIGQHSVQEMQTAETVEGYVSFINKNIQKFYEYMIMVGDDFGLNKHFTSKGKSLFCQGVQDVFEECKKKNSLLRESINNLPDTGVYARLIVNGTPFYKNYVYGPKSPIPYYIYRIQKEDLLKLIDYWENILESVSPFVMKMDDDSYYPMLVNATNAKQIKFSV